MKEKEVLAAAKEALEDAFGPKAAEHTVKVTSSPSPGLTPSDLNSITPKALEETKKLIQTFHKRMEKYAKHLSIDGATIICVKLALHSPAEINIGTLPDSDQAIIQELINNTPFRNSKKFYAMMDELKDFQIIFSENREDGSIFYLFNTVIHPPLNKSMDIPVETDADIIRIAGKEFPSRETLQRLAGVPTSKNEEDVDSETPRRKSVSGRNAFELRTDLIGMSMDLLIHNNRNSSNEISPEKVVATAKKLYSFVENRR